jgi:hypothetical protein
MSSVNNRLMSIDMLIFNFRLYTVMKEPDEIIQDNSVFI